MKQKVQLEKLEPKNEYDIKEEDLVEEVHFEIDKDAFKGPFTCHGTKTILLDKKLSFNGVDLNYSVWYCKKCKKEYLDSGQAKRLERFWLIEKLLEDKLITIERNMNFDGKTYFFRFPKELTKDLHKDDLVDIKLLNLEGKLFLIEVKSSK